MELPVLIEPLANQQGYSAQLGAPFHLRAEAATEEQARELLALQLHQRLRQGAHLSTISVPVTCPPTAAGWLPDDELTREWLAQIQQFRQECDEADRHRLLEAPEEKAAS